MGGHGRIQLNSLSQALIDGHTLDSANAEDRAAVDAYFETVQLPQIKELPAEERPEAIIGRLPIPGHMPDHSVCLLGGMVLAGPAPARVAAPSDWKFYRSAQEFP